MSIVPPPLSSTPPDLRRVLNTRQCASLPSESREVWRLGGSRPLFLDLFASVVICNAFTIAARCGISLLNARRCALAFRRRTDADASRKLSPNSLRSSVLFSDPTNACNAFAIAARHGSEPCHQHIPAFRRRADADAFEWEGGF